MFCWAVSVSPECDSLYMRPVSCSVLAAVKVAEPVCCTPGTRADMCDWECCYLNIVNMITLETFYNVSTVSRWWLQCHDNPSLHISPSPMFGMWSLKYLVRSWQWQWPELLNVLTSHYTKHYTVQTPVHRCTQGHQSEDVQDNMIHDKWTTVRVSGVTELLERSLST